jgi:hypothetical protein
MNNILETQELFSMAKFNYLLDFFFDIVPQHRPHVIRLVQLYGKGPVLNPLFQVQRAKMRLLASELNFI